MDARRVGGRGEKDSPFGVDWAWVCASGSMYQVVSSSRDLLLWWEQKDRKGIMTPAHASSFAPAEFWDTKTEAPEGAQEKGEGHHGPLCRICLFNIY